MRYHCVIVVGGVAPRYLMLAGNKASLEGAAANEYIQEMDSKCVKARYETTTYHQSAIRLFMYRCQNRE